MSFEPEAAKTDVAMTAATAVIKIKASLRIRYSSLVEDVQVIDQPLVLGLDLLLAAGLHIALFCCGKLLASMHVRHSSPDICSQRNRADAGNIPAAKTTRAKIKPNLCIRCFPLCGRTAA